MEQESSLSLPKVSIINRMLVVSTILATPRKVFLVQYEIKAKNVVLRLTFHVSV